MGFLNSINVSASGLTAEKLRMDVISKNIANANTTRTANGTPYRRQVVVFEGANGSVPFSQYLSDASKSMIGGGVKVKSITEDQTPFKLVYEPGHPDADEEGYVKMPNVDIMTEMVNMITASRAYEANVTALNTTKSIAMKALEIGR
ncbi:MAG TPA: flagellar basal body rod protein FlgC [Patescibacteria group bacterium]|jgi:flagellar basal-body rod protein FlgC|nr:flagellar basal body rod protein FlgC [Patescibacteria group bacterium]